MKKFGLLILSTLTFISMTACGSNNSNDSNGKLLTDASQDQLVFEKKYISEPFSYSDGGKFAISIISNIGSICAGVGFDSPTAVVSGVFGLLTTLNDNLNGGGITNADIMSKLNEMDTKLDAINQKLDQNYSQLMNETIRTQAMVDQVLLEEQTKAIDDFTTNYVTPIDNFNRQMSNYIDQSYKGFVTSAQTTNVNLYKTEAGEWTMRSLVDIKDSSDYTLTVSINNFDYSNEFLKEHFNIVENGFIDEFSKDIDNALSSTSLPEGLKKEDAVKFVSGNIVEKFTQKYFQEDNSRFAEIENYAINLSKQVNGKSARSIADRYVARMKYMYNFAGEIKEPITDAFANLLNKLDVTSALAAEACAYTENNPQEIKDELITARKYIQDYYKSVNEVKDNYCFATGTYLGGDFYRAHYQTEYTNPGDDCNFRAELKFETIHISNQVIYRETNINDHQVINEVDNLKISTRFDLMKEIGVSKNIDYIQYLRSSKIISEQGYQYYIYLKDVMKWISNDAYRVFTGLSVRDLNDGDRSLGLTCNGVGNPDSDYFKIGEQVTFRSKHTANNWSGKIAETTFIDGTTGKIMSNKKVAAFANYDESHCYWIDDEHWSFVDNPAGNYFFIIESVSA